MAGATGQSIHPINDDIDEQRAAHLTIKGHHKAGDQSEWLWNGDGYTKVVEPWIVADHIPPVSLTQKLGDVESWVAYVQTYGTDLSTLLLTWSETGLAATLDHPTPTGENGRRQWRAEHPFTKSDQWLRWMALANDKPRSQRDAVDSLDDLAGDIVEPSAAEVLGIVRKLRATVNVQAAAEMQADGTTKVEYSGNTEIRSGSVTLPPSIKIGIPVLKGHTVLRPATRTGANGEAVAVLDDDGQPVMVVAPVKYEIVVKIRVAADSNGQVSLRFAVPDAERVLETVFADRVATAKRLLGDLGEKLLRATA